VCVCSQSALVVRVSARGVCILNPRVYAARFEKVVACVCVCECEACVNVNLTLSVLPLARQTNTIYGMPYSLDKQRQTVEEDSGDERR
jgi:hypothetical protein